MLQNCFMSFLGHLFWLFCIENYTLLPKNNSCVDLFHFIPLTVLKNQRRESRKVAQNNFKYLYKISKNKNVHLLMLDTECYSKLSPRTLIIYYFKYNIYLS